ncbi:beta-1,4-N-acetylgalactosaminyltransferase bre-4-like [Littorina saxatilis]|uniref:Beta-1,4-galactosyltransferase n=1 Tax=Littorina saxatilis TaxID=31220 RepID=A0AAN9ARI6_9CAEN
MQNLATRKVFLACVILGFGFTCYILFFNGELRRWTTLGSRITSWTENCVSSITGKDLRAGNDTVNSASDVRSVVISGNKPLQLCPEKPPIAETKVPLNLTNVTYADLKREFGHVLRPGGHYAPITCKSRERIALIIPYRNRERNLFILLHNLIPFLMRQQAEFAVYVVEQTQDYMFDKGVLIDVGFVKARQDGDFSCFIVHDTDLIPRDYRNVYRCSDKPRHLMLNRSGEQRKKPEKLPYSAFIGGAIALTKEQFEKSNGWSTAYYGWGFEDDDMEIRLKSHGFRIVRYPIEIGDYYELGHTPQKPGPRSKLARSVKTRMNSEGLNTLNYTLVKQEKREIYNWYLVKPPPPPPEIYGNNTR